MPKYVPSYEHIHNIHTCITSTYFRSGIGPRAIAGAVVGTFAGTALSPSAWHGFLFGKKPGIQKRPGWRWRRSHKIVEAIIISAVPLACNINRDDPYFVYPFCFTKRLGQI